MAENLARQYEPQNNLQREFQAKNEILRSHFSELNPEDYLDFIFPDRDELVVVFGSLKDKEGRVIEKGTITRVHKDDVWGLAWRSNAYIPYATFIKNYYHSKTLETVRAFVVDLDDVTSRNLNRLLRYGLSKLPKPTHIVNSGKGVHLIYVLSSPQPVKGLKWSMNALNAAIQEAYGVLGQLDKHPVMHPYRFPGFQTKINTVATVFKLRESYTFEELMELFKVPKKRSDKSSGSKQKKSKAEILYLPRGSRAFFEWVLWGLFRNPPIPGRRHNSFFALGIVAYKSKREVPKWEAVEAVDMVYDDMERYNLHIGFTREEAHRAFEKGYNPKAVRVRWKYLCELLGWEYRPNKRNGRTRKEHIAYMNFIRQAKAKYRRKEIMPIVWRMLEDGLSIRQISSMLGIPKSTLSRWIKLEELEP